jgi:CBS domain-containing protein
MGDTKFGTSDPGQRTAYMGHLVDDLKALERMLADGKFESGVTRIGAEQELCLIDYALRPAMLGMELLKSLDDPHYTTELARFNAEVNLDPRELGGDCFSQLEHELIELLTRANKAAHRLGAKIILTGILPTIRDSDITLDNLTPVPRYKLLNDALRELRGEDFHFYIRGIEELITSKATVMVEGCNTSFQVHYQIDPARFASHFNWAQAIAAPVLACATNSPLFLGKRLWRETRIAVFHQSTDDRRLPSTYREQRPRVGFGHRWEKRSVVEYYQEEISRHRVLITPAMEQDTLVELKEGRIPKLKALCLFTGTVYPWNRPCYGITGGKPHLRIECRFLPAGPTIVDEVANAALWVGLMHGMPDECADLPARLRFEEAHGNFLAAAQVGLGASIDWLDGQSIPARSLLLDTLLPIARAGLQRAAVQDADIDKYLSIIEERVRSGKTGSQWILDSIERLEAESSRHEAIAATTEGIYQRQKLGHPVHRWQPSRLAEAEGARDRCSRVEHIMSTDLVTAQADEPVKLVRSLLLWSNVRHIPVEADDGTLLGVVSSESLLAKLAPGESEAELCAADVMERDPPTVTPDTPIAEAMALLASRDLTCLPVLANGKLVGIITDRDCLKIVRGLRGDRGAIAATTGEESSTVAGN